ncbi:PAS domain S-box protein [Thermodesulfobacteriota bacterium]
MKQSRPFSQILLWTAMGVVIVAVIATGILTNTTLRSIEKNLPNTLLRELHDLTLVLQDLAEVVYAAEQTKVTPNSENFKRLRNKVTTVYDGVVKLRNTYVFDNLIQASDFHAVVAPAIADLRIWLSEGVSGYGPETGTTVDIALSRISRAFQKARALNYDSQIAAQKMLNEERNRLDQFLFSVNLLFILTLVITSIMVFLFIRQQVLTRREVESQAELRRAERSIQESEELYSKLVAAIPDMVVRTDVDGQILFVNEVALQMSGYSREELEGKSILQFIATKDHEAVVENLKLMFDRKLGPKEYHLVMADGKELLFEVNSDVLRRKDGSPYGIVNVCRDITARKQAEDALRESEERYRSLFKNNHSVMLLIDPENTDIVDANPAAITFYGWNYEELTRMKITDINTLTNEQVFQEIERAKTQQRRIFYFCHRLASGEIRDVEVYSSLIFVHGRKLLYSIIYDITERKQTEDALRESEEKYRLLIGNLPNIVFKGYKDGSIDFIDDKVELLIGYKKDEFNLRKINWLDIVVEEDKEKIRQIFIEALKTDKSYVREYRVKTKTGDILWIQEGSQIVCNESGEIEYVDGAFLDITRHKKLEIQLQQLDRIESVGKLAGGIAHDFNNLLMGIQGRTSLILMDSDASHSNVEHLKGIEDYVKSAANLTRQLLGFARGGKYEVKPTDLNELIKRENQMFGRTRKEIEIRENFDKNLWTVDVDQGQIEQVLLNIYVNAWQAMPEGGDLYMQTENIIIDEEYSKPYQVEPGNYVKISITDTGVGMDEATRQRIFDPFFTTKEMGRGTGLGLASAYGIIKNHNGFINVYSETDEGTTFNIYLPASEKEAVKEEKLNEKLFKGTETLLLVDDEDIIIEVGQGIIENLGYKVLTAKSGKEAIEIYEKNRGRIDMVILDMIMPDMGGGETYDRLKEINPDIKVLLASGYSINGQATEILERGCNGFIQKPFNITDLSKRIREILDEE